MSFLIATYLKFVVFPSFNALLMHYKSAIGSSVLSQDSSDYESIFDARYGEVDYITIFFNEFSSYESSPDSYSSYELSYSSYDSSAD